MIVAFVHVCSPRLRALSAHGACTSALFVGWFSQLHPLTQLHTLMQLYSHSCTCCTLSRSCTLAHGYTFSRSCTLTCVPHLAGVSRTAVPHLAGFSHAVAAALSHVVILSQLYPRTRLHSLMQLYAHSCTRCTLSRSCTLTVVPHVAGLSQLYSLHTLAQLDSHNCTRCTLSRSWTLAFTMSDEACFVQGTFGAHPEQIMCDEDLPGECVVALDHRELKRVCY